jgi:shikimate dehydrogenase
MANLKTFGLLGSPVKHSLSPLMHNAAFKALGISAEYKLFEIKPEDLSGFLSKLEEFSISGLNVTVPFKEVVMEFAKPGPGQDHLRQVGAVNTMVKMDGAWTGFNTDIPGFERHLLENFNPKGKSCAVLGAGGAARAVVYVLARLGANRISVFDIDRQKAESVCFMARAVFPGFEIAHTKGIQELGLKDKDLLVNCTPVGMKISDPELVNKDNLHKNIFVYDLIYNPGETRLLNDAQDKGCRTANGLGMLLYQGVLSFQYFTGQNAPIEIMRKALNEGVRQE